MHTMSFVFDFQVKFFWAIVRFLMLWNSIFENKFILGEGGRFDRNARS